MITCIIVLKYCILYYILHFHFPFYLFYFPFLIKEILNKSIYGVYNYQDCKQWVGARIDTLMSISGGLGLSIFCRKIEKAHPMKEHMDGKFVYLPTWIGIFDFDDMIYKVLFSYLYLWHGV